MTNQLPNGWLNAPLKNICDRIVDGSHNPPKGEVTGLPMLSARNVNKNRIIFDDFRLISKENFEMENRRTNVQANDVLLTIVGALGRTCIIQESTPIFTLQRSVAVLKQKNILSSYLKHALDSPDIQKYILNNAKGTAQKGIYLKALGEMTLPIPPLPEQKEIATRLDNLLAQVDTLKTRLDAIPAILKRFRQSVLAAAVSGKLTEEWRKQNPLHPDILKLTSLKNLLLKEKIIKKDLEIKNGTPWFEIPDIWEFFELSSFALKVTDGEHQTPKREKKGKYLLSARNIRDGFIDLSNVDYVGDEEFEKIRSRCNPDKNDILISCSGSVGRVSLVDENNKYVMVRSAALVKTIEDVINNKYLMYVLQSIYLQIQIEEKSKSTAQSNLFLGQIKELGIPYPHIKEQTEIVRSVEQLFAFADQIEQRVQSAQKRVNHLTQAILAKAFRGELTADWREQNPDLISGENSAEALLARIKTERKK